MASSVDSDMGRDSMLNDVYNRRILELAGHNPPDWPAGKPGRLGDRPFQVVRLDRDDRPEDGRRHVTDFAHEVKACALGQASSSIMARNVVGAKADELRALRETVRKMLKENGAPPADGKWADIAVLEPVRDYKARHASTC